MARFVSALLRRYARLFDGACTAQLHHMVRRLSEADVSMRVGNTTLPRVMEPERLGAELGLPVRCDDLWWRDPQCKFSN